MAHFFLGAWAKALPAALLALSLKRPSRRTPEAMLATRLLVCFEFFAMVNHLFLDMGLLDSGSTWMYGLSAGLRSVTIADRSLDMNASHDSLHTGGGMDGNFTNSHDNIPSPHLFTCF